MRNEKKQQLRKSMIEGYQVNSATDAKTAEAWRSLEEEAELLVGVRESEKN